MGIASTSGAFCVLGVYQHLKPTRIQYQIVWFAPCIYIGLCLVASFGLCESPRWLFLVNRPDEASLTLAKLRGLPISHPVVQRELEEIRTAIERERCENSGGLLGIVKETFLVPANLRRVQQSIVTYGLAQLSGANSITSYFIPILTIVGVGGDTARNMFLSAMVGISVPSLIFANLPNSTHSPNSGSLSSRPSSSSMPWADGDLCSLEQRCK